VRAAIVVGVEEGVVPQRTGHRDEERRLLCVAMTRSTEYLYLTWSGRLNRADGARRSAEGRSGPEPVPACDARTGSVDRRPRLAEVPRYLVGRD
jgi:ATP-dependent exoDNAse (exonuclease V) beta subunit